MTARVRPKPLRFSASWHQTEREIGDVLYDLGADDSRIETPAHHRARYEAVLPREQRVVTVSWVEDGKPVSVSCDTQTTAKGNLRALYYALHARRMNIIRGVDDIARSVYLQLEAPKQTRDPYEVLQARPDADRDTIDALFRLRAKQTHPDQGGTTEAFEEVQGAKERIYEQRGWS